MDRMIAIRVHVGKEAVRFRHAIFHAVGGCPILSGAPMPDGAINATAINNAGVLFGGDSNQGGTAAVDLVTINTATGAVTNVGALPNNTDALAFQLAAITPPPPSGTPIPTTLLLAVTGLASVLIYRFRKKLLPPRI